MVPDVRSLPGKAVRNKAFLVLVVVCITAGAYWQVGRHDFINYDDPRYVVNNPHVNSGLSGENVRWAFATFSESNWHPLTWLSHMVDVRLFGMDAGRQHLVNVLFHLANTVLLFLFLDRATGAGAQSLFVAALFALHPLHVESVAWVAERKDVLSTLFWMLTLISYVRYVERPGRSRYVCVLLAFAFGLMSKPMLVTLPFALLLLDYWPLGRMGPGGSNPTRLLLEKVPLVALSIASAVVTILAQQKGGSVAHLKGLPLVSRCANALSAYVSYLGKTIWPDNLAVIYPLAPTLTMLPALGAGLMLVCITAICLRSARRHPCLIVGWLWYLLTLVPVIGVVQVGLQSIADRYTYVPLIGLFVMAAWGAPVLFSDRPGKRVVLSSAAGLMLLACAVLTWRQTGYWKDTITLFTHAVDAVDRNYVAHNILGDTFVEMGRTEDAILHYSMVLQVWPDDGNALVGMGNALLKQGRGKDALRYLDEELRIDPRSSDGHFYRGAVLMEEGELDAAIADDREALRTDPGRADARMNLGTALIRQGRFGEGLRCYEEALAGDPNNAEMHVTAGLALAMAGRLEEGIAHFREAVRAKPGFADAHYNLGAALARLGRYDEAMAHFREAVRLDPGLEAARSGLSAAAARKQAENKGND